MRSLTLLALLFVSLTLVACGEPAADLPENPETMEDFLAIAEATSDAMSPEDLETSEASLTLHEDPGYVNQLDFENEYGPGTWPVSATSGVLSCEGDAVTFEADEGDGVFNVYAVNGTAEQQGVQEIDPIWLDDPDIDGAKISISPFIEIGLELCE